MDTHSYYNIHSHTPGNAADTLTIVSKYKDFAADPAMLCSVGLHPWYLEHADDVFATLKNVARQPNVLAIGECGLDKVKGAPLAEQTNIFIQQILLANAVNKPLIVHCVQAHEEVLQVFKQYAPAVPVIFHGFNRKLSIAQRLLDEGHYLSFGAGILQNKITAEVAASIDSQRIFLETDDAAVNIKDIYKKAAGLRNTDVETLILQLGHNFNAVFGL